MKIKYIFLIIISIVYSCEDKTKQIDTLKPVIKNQYAKGFSLEKIKNYTKLTIYTSFNDDDNPSIYYLVPKNKAIDTAIKDQKNIIRTPIERIVVTSTTHIPMLELLNVEKTLVGFPTTKYISSQKTRALIDSGTVLDLGQEQNINTELLIDLNPELIIGFGVNATSQAYKNIEKMGIPVIMNSDWLEKKPLGKVEWLRFFGSLYEKESLAKKKFKEIETHYLEIKKQLNHVTTQPVVFSGSLFQDVWYMPAGESFMAQFFTDAKADYIWKASQGTGSLSLSLESVLDKAKDAEYWIAPGFYTSKNAMLKDSPHYKEFKAFAENKIYTYALNKGVTGGVLYFELAVTRPDLVLQDLASIFHPEVFPNAKRTFFKKL